MDADRFSKLEKIRALGITVYPDRFEQTFHLADALNAEEGTVVRVAGRMMTFRDMGKITFAHLQDISGQMQVVFQTDVLSKEQYDMLKLLDLGDIIGLEGKIFTTQKGEISVLVESYELLSKCLRPLPEKWHGLKDKETAHRQRYLDLISNRESMERFLFRSRFIRSLRDFYWKHDFIELETPVLQPNASGALAKPFSTHHNALDHDFFLRIALETHQKEALVGGFERTFEIGKVFRNEGISPAHLQEFTMCEHYAAYWNFEDNMRFTQEMFQHLLEETMGTQKVEILDREGNKHEVDFSGDWPVVSMRDLIKKDCGIDIEKFDSADALRKEIKKKKIVIEDVESFEIGNLIDHLYKKVSRPQIVQPTFLVQHPVELSPLARRNDENPKIVDRFQLLVSGWEIINAYSELVDPVDQAGRFEQQAAAKDSGDDDAHGKDDEYVTAMEHGMPPQSGWGMGIDRIVALLTQQDNLKDTVLFPLMKPEQRQQSSALSGFADEVSAQFPGLKHGICVLEGVSLKQSDKKVAAFVKEILAELDPADLKKNSEHLKAYKKLFKGFGMDPSKKKPSPVALVDRLSAGKDFPQINTLVDIYNALVVKHQISMGAFDLDQMQMPLQLRFSQEGDVFTPIGSSEASALKPGELCYFDAADLCITEAYNYRDNDITKADLGSETIVLIVDGNDTHSMKDVEEAMAELQEAVLHFCGGSIRETHFLTAS